MIDSSVWISKKFSLVIISDIYLCFLPFDFQKTIVDKTYIYIYIYIVKVKLVNSHWFKVNKICKVDSMPDECNGRKLRNSQTIVTTVILILKIVILKLENPLRKKCPYWELFWSVFFPKNAGKIMTRITPNTETFYAVIINRFN